MLINANSGGGKSFCLRRLLEQSFGKIQHLVIDLEGEFSTLREKFDYLLVGKDGEIPANIRTSELLAKKLLQLKVSTIIDLSELKHPERITFVKRFLDSLINSPKELWHPLLVVIDEAHIFCPEGSKSESASAVIDLATRGRKRGFGCIISTQRISKLNKDAAAELNNVMTGRTGLDIDQKRAGELLGFASKEDIRGLRNLGEGEFYCFGVAFNHPGVEKFVVGKVKTTHPDKTKGVEISKPSQTPDNIKKLLKDIIDLPKEAEEELKTLNDYKNKVRELKTKLTIAERQKANPTIKSDEKSLEMARKQGIKETEKEYVLRIKEMEKENASIFYRQESLIKNYEKKIKDIGKIIGKEVTESIPKNYKFKTPMPVSIPRITQLTHESNQVEPMLQKESFESVNDGTDVKLKSGAMRILNFIAMFDELTRNKAKTLSGISSQGTFSTYVQDLKRAGYIELNGINLKITEDGMNFVGDVEQMPTDTESLINLWSKHIKSGAIRMLRICVECYPNPITRQELQEQSGIQSQGTFSTYLQDLKRNGLIKLNGQDITASEELFE
jgi:hypothetical protein